MSLLLLILASTVFLGSYFKAKKLLRKTSPMAAPSLEKTEEFKTAEFSTDKNLLKICAGILGLSHALVIEIMEEGAWSTVDSFGGDVLLPSLEEASFLNQSIKSVEPLLAIEYASIGNWRHSGAFKSSRWESYFACRIEQDGAKIGLIAFYSNLPKSEPFKKADKQLLEQLSKFYLKEILRNRSETSGAEHAGLVA